MYKMPNANSSFPNSTTFIQQPHHHHHHQQNNIISINNNNNHNTSTATNQKQYDLIGREPNHQLPVEQHYYRPYHDSSPERPVGDPLRLHHDDPISITLDEIGAIINSKEFEDISLPNAKSSQLHHLSNGMVQVGDQATAQNNDTYLAREYQQAKVRCNPNELINLDTNFNQNNIDSDSSRQQANFRYANSDIDYLQVKQEHPIAAVSPASCHNENTQQPDYIMSSQNRNNNPLTLTKNPFTYNAYDKKSRPYVEIVEQPAKCALRFRYKCEGRSAGSLPGAHSSADNKTFPAIRINNYVGQASIVISCVTKDAPYRAHPHNIVGKEGCKKGICTVLVNNEPNMIRSFSSLGIQCVKRKDIEESLSVRESIQVDPFRNGFEHKLNSSTIDLNVVRLCFQVFIEGSTPGRRDVPLTPVVTDPIHDKKAMSDLVITKLSHCSAPATGSREVILLCDRISKDDIQLRFYEERDGKVVWETYTDVSPTDVHKQVAICFKTPKYHNENITQPVMARIQLRRVSDNQFSEPRYFQFLPCESDEDIISRKRQKIEWVNVNHYALDNILQPQPQPQQHMILGGNHIERQQNAPEACLASPLHHQHPTPTANPSQPQARSPRQASPINNTIARPNPSQQHQHHHHLHPQPQPQQAQQSSPQPQQQQLQDLVVRHEIIDNEGRMVRLVDRPQQESNNVPANRVPLGNSLDGIHISELMPDMTSFNLNAADFNIGSGLAINLNGTDMMPMEQQQQQNSIPANPLGPNSSRTTATTTATTRATKCTNDKSLYNLNHYPSVKSTTDK